MDYNNLDSMTEREQKIAIHWRDKGLKHADPSPSTKEFMEQTETNLAVISEKIENLFGLMRSQHEENKIDLKDIKDKQDHTNGDVTLLKSWKDRLLGAWVVVSFVSMVIVPAIFYLYIQNLKYEINELTKKAIAEEISKFIIKE